MTEHIEQYRSQIDNAVRRLDEQVIYKLNKHDSPSCRTMNTIYGKSMSAVESHNDHVQLTAVTVKPMLCLAGSMEMNNSVLPVLWGRNVPAWRRQMK